MTSDVPKTLADTVRALDALVSDEFREDVQEATDGAQVRKLIIGLHHGLGQHIRNKWGLWQGSELAQDLKNNHGIEHPDDMSHRILVHYSEATIRTRFERLEDTDFDEET